MSKISLIIKREYTTRVMKKSFLLLTFLTPILLAGMVALVFYLSSIKDDKVKTIMLVDETGLYSNTLESNNTYIFHTFVVACRFVESTPKRRRFLGGFTYQKTICEPTLHQ